MADYVELPLIDDPDALLEVGVEYAENAMPGLQLRPGNPETVLLEANSQIAAEVVQQAAQVPPVAFAYAGQSLFGIPIFDAVPAAATATITFAADVAATMIAAESMLAVPHPSGEGVVFTLDDDVVAPAGGGAVNVGVSALEAGSAANGAFGDSELVDVIDGVDSVYVSEASGGVDEESDDEYLDRLASALTLLAPRPILPNDFAVMAQQVPGVGRATAIDLYQPGTNDGPPGPIGAPLAGAAGASNVPRCVTVAITDELGHAPTVVLMQAVWDALNARREVNFLEYVISPKYQAIDVQATVKAYPGRTLADVQAACVAMMQTWLDPNTYGTPTTTGSSSEWVADNTIRYTELIDWLNRADGVNYVVAAQLRKAGGVFGTADVAITGVAALPTVGSIAITVQ
jgi:hypothetical protein